MNLRALAAADLNAITTDLAVGAWSFTLTNPQGVSAVGAGLPNDITQSLDPGTGQLIVGRSAAIFVANAELDRMALGTPDGVANRSAKPWVVAIDGNTFKVSEANPDRTMGGVLLMLEVYGP